MIVDEDVVLVKNNVEDDTSQFIANNRNDDMSSLTIEDKLIYVPIISILQIAEITLKRILKKRKR